MEPDALELEFQQTTSRAGLIGLSALLGALLGFVLQLLVAFYFGAAGNTDAFFMAQSTSEMLSKLLLGGSIASVFLPMFVERLARGKKADAWNLALNLLNLLAVIFVVPLVAIGIFAGPFIRLIAPGFEGETFTLTVNLLRTLLPSFLFLFLVELATVMLHALRQFALPASLRLVSPTVSIFFVLLLVEKLGIYSLALGVVAGAIIQLAILLWGLRRQGLRYRFIFQPRDAAIKKLLRLVYPFIFSVLATQAAGIVYRILVSDLSAGSLSALKFAEKITQLLTVVFLGSITAAIFPSLSHKASVQDYAGIRATLASAVRLIVFLTIPIIIGVALLREPLIAFVYQRGAFSPEDSAMTAIALLFLVIGLTTNGVSSALGHATLALQKTRAAAAVTIASQLVAISLFFWLTPRLAHAGLALASSLVPLAIALLYFIYLKRFIPGLGRIFWHPTYVKTIIASTALAGAVTFTQTYFQEIFPFSQLLLPTVVGAATYFAAARFLRIPELNQLLAIFSKKVSSSR